jgi:hypothetical protein
MAHSLIEHLQNVPDFRRGQGKRFSVEQMLMMIIFGIMSGRYGYRELGTFVRSNTAAFQELLGIRQARMPSHVSIRTFLMHIDFAAVAAAFAAWAAAHLVIAPGDLLSIDGKALGSTLRQTYDSAQDFVALVSVYCQRQRSVLALARYHNGQSSEAVTLRELIMGLNCTGALISADALHCQKKHSRGSSTAATTI